MWIVDNFYSHPGFKDVFVNVTCGPNELYDGSLFVVFEWYNVSTSKKPFLISIQEHEISKEKWAEFYEVEVVNGVIRRKERKSKEDKSSIPEYIPYTQNDAEA